MNDVERRELVARVPHLRTLLGAGFNYDWDLDHESAEAVYSSVVDDLDPRSRQMYLTEAKILEGALKTDVDVQAFLNFVGSGLAPSLHLDVPLAEWPTSLVRRIELSR